MSLCAHLTIYPAFFDLWYLSCLLYNIERDENLYDNSLTQFAFLLYVHSPFTRTYNIDNKGDFTFASEINMIYILSIINIIIYCCLENYRFAPCQRNQFSPNLCNELTSIELYAKFSQTTPSYSDIFATDQCNLSTFHSPLNSFRARVKEHYDRLIIIGQDKQAKVLKIFRENCTMSFSTSAIEAFLEFYYQCLIISLNENTWK